MCKYNIKQKYVSKNLKVNFQIYLDGAASASEEGNHINKMYEQKEEM